MNRLIFTGLLAATAASMAGVTAAANWKPQLPLVESKVVEAKISRSVDAPIARPLIANSTSANTDFAWLFQTPSQSPQMRLVPGAFATTLPAPEVAARLAVLPSAREAALWDEPLRPGERAPDFALPDQNGRFHRLSDLRGKTVVLSFYPQDFTYMCSAVAVDFDRQTPAFAAREAVVFSVSVQPVASKQRFASQFGMKHPLLADSDRAVVRAYRVLNRDGLAARVTFIIGPNGRILSTDQNVRAQTHVADVLARLDRPKMALEF